METVYVDEVSDDILKCLKAIRAAGIKIELDDFGSGLSSLAYLKNFKINYLKIDGSFVRNMVDDSTDRAMVRAIHSVGQTLGLETIAEFVETEEHIDLLRQIGVDYLQGYALGRPEPMVAQHHQNCAVIQRPAPATATPLSASTP